MELATDLPNSLLRALRRCLQDRQGSGLMEGHAELPEKSILAWLSNVTMMSKRRLPITPNLSP